MSSGRPNPSLLVVSNRVYAKADDGVFYSGSVESKLEDNSYVVRFAGDKKGLVRREEDLVWLGFCGLQTSWWPENPVVQPTISSDDTFEGTVRFVGNVAKAPASFTVRNNEDVKRSSTGGDLPGEKLLLGDREKQRTQDLFGWFPEVQGGVKQTRSSVIRFNRDLLHGERSNHNRPGCLSTTSLNETTSFIPGYTSEKSSEPQIQHKYSVKVSPMHHGRSRYPPKATYKTEGSSRCETRKEQIRDCGDKLSFNESNITPPISPCDSADCTSWGLAAIGTDCESVPRGEAMENTQFLKKGHAKKRKKRSETRKCRKVYGIDHRQAWCTSCKWKKACTRFRECEKKC